MKKLGLLAALAIFGSACTPKIQHAAAPSQVHARFDPSQTPPVVPSPNDLATDPNTGLLAVPLPPNATDADKAVVDYLNQLDGFPADSPAEATFDGDLDPATATLDSVRVFDVTAGNAAVSGLAVTLQNDRVTGTDEKASLSISPPAAGWTPGHTYAVALVSGDHGLQGKGNVPVVGSAAWGLVRSTKPLVTCTGSAVNTCRATTTLIPSSQTDPAKRIEDQAAKAQQLEQVRLKYAPLLGLLESQSIPRANVPLLWSFKIATVTSVAFQPAGSLPQVPTPNDLAIDPTTHLVHAPIDPRTPAANQEFTQDYLNTLDGFPVITTASATIVGGDLDPNSIRPSDVAVIDVTSAKSGGLPAVSGTQVTYDAFLHAINIAPPPTGWVKAHTYAVAIIGGAAGVRTTQGDEVYGSDAWVLARGTGSLVTCTDLTSPSCQSAVHVVDLAAADAVALERVRLGYQPVLDLVHTLYGANREDVAAAWTFTAVSQAEPTFNLDSDPSKAIIPFPNTLLVTSFADGGQQVNLPIPSGPGVPAALTQLYTGLDTLDGFSTTAAILSAQGAAAPNGEPALTDGAKLEVSSLDGGVGLLKLASGGTTPVYRACVTDTAGCSLTTPADAGFVQQLFIRPVLPLDERTSYGAYLTTDLTDTRGKHVAAPLTWALVRLNNSLLDSTFTRSQVSGVSDAQAQQLELVRGSFKPLVDAVVASGTPRSKLALAWSFKTQSEASVLAKLHALPTALAPLLSSKVLYAVDVTSTLNAQLDAAHVPHSHVAKWFTGEFLVANALTGPGGTLNPSAPLLQRIPFLVATPTTGASTVPTVLFNHALHGYYRQMVAIADSFAAAGQATIAADVVLHGERSQCVGAASALGAGATDDDACANKTTQKCDETVGSATYGRCIARSDATRAPCDLGATGGLPGDLYCANIPAGSGGPQGQCLADSKCEGGDWLRDGTGKPVISGWNILNLSNLFAGRDNFRQQVIDLAQLVRVINDASTAAPDGSGGLNALLVAQGAPALDTAHLNFAGQSLGGVLGTLYNAVAPETHNVVLNVPGGDLINILLTSPGFAPLAAGLTTQLAQVGISPATPAFDNFLETARWILDPADPVNMGYGLTHNVVPGLTTLPADRKVFIQSIEGDAVIPNGPTDELIAAANRAGDPQQCTTYRFSGLDASVVVSTRHGFLLSPPTSTPASVGQQLTATGQLQAASFVSTGTLP